MINHLPLLTFRIKIKHAKLRDSLPVREYLYISVFNLYVLTIIRLVELAEWRSRELDDTGGAIWGGDFGGCMFVAILRYEH